MTNRHTQDVFNQTAPTYDPARTRLIPCFDTFYRTTVDLMSETTDHVLDLGAGTGLLSAFVRERFPDAHLHMIDSSDSMLAQARQRFSRDQETVFQLADYTTAQWGSQYDAVISALSIHHLEDAAKKQLFEKIHNAVKPGGIFINAEQILAPTPQLEEQAKADWLAEVRALGATDEEVAASLLRQTEDRSATVADQLRWMQHAGLKNVRCSFAQGRFAVLSGVQ